MAAVGFTLSLSLPREPGIGNSETVNDHCHSQLASPVSRALQLRDAYVGRRRQPGTLTCVPRELGIATQRKRS